MVPPPPKCPLPKRPTAKDLLGRTFHDDDHFGSNGEVEFEGGEFIVQSVVTGGKFVMCVRKDGRDDSKSEKYQCNAVKEMVQEWEAKTD